MDNAPEPDPLGFVQDRITILRAAHTLMKEWGMTFDVADLLDVAGWLAGDTLPIVIDRPGEDGPDDDENDDESESESEDGTGA